MYENNDLYNLDFGVDENASEQDISKSEWDNEQRAEQNSEPEPTETKAQPNEQRADRANPQPSTEPQRTQDSSQATLTNEQLDYIERGRQREALILMCDKVKSSIPDFDFEKIAPQILKMPEAQAKEYLTPLGLEALWRRSFGTSYAGVVDGSKEPSYDMSDVMDKLAKGQANDDEELEFYKHLGRIAGG